MSNQRFKQQVFVAGGLVLLTSLSGHLTFAQTVSPKPAPTGSIYEELIPKRTPAPINVPPASKAPVATSQISIPANTGGEGIVLNAVDLDIKELIKQISNMTGKNFLIGEQVRGKVTIISEKKMSIDEAYQAFLSALEVNGYTVVDAPGGLTKIIPIKDIANVPLPIYKENSPYTDAFITRIIQLKNISAMDMSNAIKNLISKRGNLFAYPATNTLIVTDTGTNIDRLLKITGELDQVGPEEGLEFITLRNAKAKDVATRITELYVKDQGQANQPRRRVGANTGEFDETPYISKIIADERTNSVIVLASSRAMDKVRALVAQLDRQLPNGVEGSIHVHYLKNANAKDVAQVLTSLTQGSAQASANTPGSKPGGAPIAASFEGGIKVAADENTNALVITATAKDYETLRGEVLDKLDIPRRQVYIEAVIMELTINKNRSLGISGQGGGLFGVKGNDVLGFGSILGGTIEGLSASALNGLAAGAVSSSTIDIPTGDGSSINVPAFGVVLNALQTENNVNVLSTPNILTMDNEEATIHVGEDIPLPGPTTIGSGGVTSIGSPERRPVGVTLTVTPQISEGDQVRLKIEQKVEDVVGGSSENILTKLGATFSTRNVKTTVIAKDEQTIVIGGLIKDSLETSNSKIPLLGDIPLLGNLFTKRAKAKTKTNLLVFLRPYIIRDSTDYLKILQRKVEERNMFIEQNYGKAQQKGIRDSIRTHAAELLDFKKDIQEVSYDVTPSGKRAPDQEINNPDLVSK